MPIMLRLCVIAMAHRRSAPFLISTADDRTHQPQDRPWRQLQHGQSHLPADHLPSANDKTAASPSPPFHVKRRRGSIATSISLWSGRPRPISSRRRRFRISGPDTSPIRFSSWTWLRQRRSGSISAAAAAFPAWFSPARLAETPGANVHLVERNAKKAAFLREAVRITSAAATVHLAGIGDSVDRIGSRVDCVTARALAPLHQLVGFAEPFVSRRRESVVSQGPRCRG